MVLSISSASYVGGQIMKGIVIVAEAGLFACGRLISCSLSVLNMSMEVSVGLKLTVSKQ